MTRAAGALICLLLGLAPAAAQPAAPLSAQTELLAADRAFSRLSVTRGRAYAVLAMAMPNAQIFGIDGAQPVQGRQQAFRALARRQAGRMGWEPLGAGVSPDGRMGWTDGRWEVIERSQTISRGYYLTVWVKDRRNAWKVQTSMNSGASAPTRAIR